MNKLLLILGLFCMSCSSTRPIEMEHCQAKCAPSGGVSEVAGGCGGMVVTSCKCRDDTNITYFEPGDR